MDQVQQSVFQSVLSDRRSQLQSVRQRIPDSRELSRLLSEVDAALRRIADGVFGICETCHDPIEEDRLLADPMVRFCIDHLTQADRRALEADLAMAREIQTALLPKFPLENLGWQASYRYEPAGPVSGDYCDVIVRDGRGPMLFLTGDVSGKGVAASLLVAHLHSAFHSISGAGVTLPQMLAQTNRLLCESTLPAHYATLVCALAHDSGSVEICNAGHPPPILAGSGRQALEEPGGLPLGMFCSASYGVQTFEMSPGQTLLFYTDGLTEATNGNGEPYGMERLVAVLESCQGGPAQSTVETCYRDWRQFRGEAPQADDLTILAMRRLGAAN